jgi:hypothetical protein
VINYQLPLTKPSIAVDRDFMTPLLSFKEPLLELYSNAAESAIDLLQYKGCHGLYVMAASRHFLKEEQVSFIFVLYYHFAWF